MRAMAKISVLALAAFVAISFAASAQAQANVTSASFTITLYTGTNFTGDRVTFSSNLTSSSRVLKSDDFSKLNLNFTLDNNVRSVRFVSDQRTLRLRLYNEPCSGQDTDSSYVEVLPNTTVDNLNATASALVVLLVQNPTYVLRCTAAPAPNPSVSPAPVPPIIPDDITQYCPPNDLTDPATVPAGYTLLVPPVHAGTYAWTADASVPEQYFVCTVPTHCTDHGMIIKVNTVPAPADYVPRTTRIFWRFDNYTDLIVTAGDRVFFNWTGTHSLAVYVPPGAPAPAPVPPVNTPISPTYACPNPPNASNPDVTVLAPIATHGSYVYVANASVPRLYLFCPVGNHCKSGGMIFQISTNPALPNYVPRNISVDWAFGNYSSLTLTAGDMVNITWNGTIPHGVAMIPAPSPISPVGACPANTSDPGVSILSTVGTSGNYSYVANASLPFVYLYCPVGNGYHCKTGHMIFEVQTMPAPTNYTPVTYVITPWAFGQYAPLMLYDGDRVNLTWSASVPHAVALIKPVSPTNMCPYNASAPGVVPLFNPVINGTYYYVANATIPNVYLYCPVGNHCSQGGMIFQLTTIPAPPGYAPRILNLTWEFMQYPHLSLVEGDILLLHWSGSIPHGIFAYLPPVNMTMSPSPSTPSPVVVAPPMNAPSPMAYPPNPYPAQTYPPVYGESPSTSPGVNPPAASPASPPVVSPTSACPSNPASGTILAAQSGSGNYTYTASVTSPSVYLYCPVGNHCQRGKMIMLVNTIPASSGHVPTTHNIDWQINMDYPQLDLQDGDMINFAWNSFHGVSVIPNSA